MNEARSEEVTPSGKSAGFGGGAPTKMPAFHGHLNPPNSLTNRPNKTIRSSAKMGESLFIVEYDGSVPLNAADNWPLPSYEVRRKLPMKECHICHSDMFYEGRRLHRARRTSWVIRKKGEFYWFRVCFEHMKPEVRAVIKEMYSR